jgi:MYXO-CTERM domain-containing protein
VDGQSPETPVSTTRDGSSLTLTWQSSSSFTANTGSGLVGLSAVQTCDCDVPVGKHDYVVRVKSAMGGSEMDYPTSVEVLQDLQLPKDAGVPGGDMMPWDIPEPGEVQGLDCRTVCTTGGDGPIVVKDAALPDTSTPDAGVTPDSGQQPPPKQEDDGGCSLGSPGGAPLFGLLLLAGIGLALLRRR